ncbi:uncharacterized protein LOC111605159 [Drosophila hydei]|uniref:Uncharacterized protein LOC111605159 n=1 Tax=Drosophila hydei TaxID=7224 RepID=A0A6J1MIN9_DROHY|nr:uncharacterized protein LOC111605159 [Drosophila hydei]
MGEVQMLLDDLGHTFSKFKEQRRIEMLKLFSQVRCCDCGHKLRMLDVQKKAAKMSAGAKRSLTACLMVLLLLGGFWIYMTRRYNHVAAFGSGACVATFFYTNSDCDVYV